MSPLLFHYTSLAVYIVAGIAALIAVVSLVQLLSPRQLSPRNRQAKSFAIAMFLCVSLLGAHYAYGEWYFWPAYFESQKLRARALPNLMLVAKNEVVSRTEITTIDGEKIVLGGNDGTIVVVNLFATWCGPCIQELPELQKSWDYFKSFPFVKYVIVGRGQTEETLREFAKERNYSLPFAADEDASFFKTFAKEKEGIPITLLILPDGTVAMIQHGYGGEPLHHLNARLDLLTSVLHESNHGVTKQSETQ